MCIRSQVKCSSYVTNSSAHTYLCAARPPRSPLPSRPPASPAACSHCGTPRVASRSPPSTFPPEHAWKSPPAPPSTAARPPPLSSPWQAPFHHHLPLPRLALHPLFLSPRCTARHFSRRCSELWTRSPCSSALPPRVHVHCCFNLPPSSSPPPPLFAAQRIASHSSHRITRIAPSTTLRPAHCSLRTWLRLPLAAAAPSPPPALRPAASRSSSTALHGIHGIHGIHATDLRIGTCSSAFFICLHRIAPASPPHHPPLLLGSSDTSIYFFPLLLYSSTCALLRPGLALCGPRSSTGAA